LMGLIEPNSIPENRNWWTWQNHSQPGRIEIDELNRITNNTGESKSMNLRESKLREALQGSTDGSSYR
jgi:hypothetical protein